MPRRDPFPRDAQGRLINPDYIQAEGERIRAAIAAGTFGAQPQTLAPLVTTVPVAPVAAAPFGMTTDVSGNSFFNEPSIWERNQNPAQLRQQLRLDELTNLAAKRKFDLEQAQQQAPLQDALTRARLAHQLASTNAVGAHDLMLKQNDVAGMNAYASFVTDLHAPGTPRPGDRGYDEHFRRTLVANKEMTRTPIGRQTALQFAKDHDLGTGISGLQPPEGFAVASVSQGANGKTRTTFKPVNPDTQLAKDAKTFGLSLSQVRNPIGAEVGRNVRQEGGRTKFVGDPTGDIVRVQGKDNKMVSLSTKEYERLGGTYSGETLAARGAAPTLSTTPVQVNSIEEANALPSGTTFLIPTGQLKRKP